MSDETQPPAKKLTDKDRAAYQQSRAEDLAWFAQQPERLGDVARRQQQVDRVKAAQEARAKQDATPAPTRAVRDVQAKYRVQRVTDATEGLGQQRLPRFGIQTAVPNGDGWVTTHEFSDPKQLAAHYDKVPGEEGIHKRLVVNGAVVVKPAKRKRKKKESLVKPENTYVAPEVRKGKTGI